MSSNRTFYKKSEPREPIIYKKTFDIKGMHCNSCELLISDELSRITNIKKCRVSFKRGQAEVFHTGHLDEEKVGNAIAQAGYSLGKDERTFFSHNPQDYTSLLMTIMVFLVVYFIALALGIFEMGSMTGTNYSSLPVVFLIGLTAGISTCMAVVGGLVLGASARFAEKHPLATSLQKFKPHIFFNLGRIASYTLLGGLIGYVGSFFQLSTDLLGFLLIAVGFIMLIIGIQLIGIVPGIERLKITIPSGISRFFGITEKSNKEYSHSNSALMGAMTFFLPCGFTQAMQLYSMSSGSPIVGALTMGTFALGTAPGLLGVGGLTSMVKGVFAKYFFRFAGIVVILLSLFNINNGMNLSGYIFTDLLFRQQAAAIGDDPNVTLENGVQIVKMTESSRGYEPNTFTIQKGIPVKWVINAEDIYSCANSIVSSKLDIRKGLRVGENIIEFTPTELGTLTFSCIMGMYRGQFNVIEAKETPPQTDDFQKLITPEITETQSPTPETIDPDAQVIKATYSLDNDIQPTRFTVKAGRPVRFEIAALDNGAGCMGTILIPGLTDTPQIFEKGKTVVMNFIPKKGKYQIACAMGVPRGVIIAE